MDRSGQIEHDAGEITSLARSSSSGSAFGVSADPNDPSTWRPSPGSFDRPAGLLIDSDDRDLLGWRWFIDSCGYARRSVRTSRGRVTVYLHRIVLSRSIARGLVRGELCDHVNGVRLDCRRLNLRVVDAAGNTQNVHGNRRNRAGGLRGVSWNASAQKWQATVRHNGRNQYLGLYSDAKEAAAVAARRRAELGFADANPTSKELADVLNRNAA